MGCFFSATYKQSNFTCMSFKALKKTAEYQSFFCENITNKNLKNIQRVFFNYREIPFKYYLLYKVLLDSKAIIVNSQTMPTLHSYLKAYVQSTNCQPLSYLSLTRKIYLMPMHQKFLPAAVV